MGVRKATLKEIGDCWNKKIEQQPNNPAYKIWKKDQINGNKKMI